MNITLKKLNAIKQSIFFFKLKLPAFMLFCFFWVLNLNTARAQISQCPEGDPLQWDWIQALIPNQAECSVGKIYQFEREGETYFGTQQSWIDENGQPCASDYPSLLFTCNGEFICEFGLTDPNSSRGCATNFGTAYPVTGDTPTTTIWNNYGNANTVVNLSGCPGDVFEWQVATFSQTQTNCIPLDQQIEIIAPSNEPVITNFTQVDDCNIAFNFNREGEFIYTVSTGEGNNETISWTFNLYYSLDCSNVSGCNDPTACNYDPITDINDGTCIYEADCKGNVKCHIDDWLTLKALYESTNGDNWKDNTGWDEVKGNEPSTDCNLELFYKVELDENGRVFKLNLTFNQLSGSIPPELGNLKNLVELNLTANQLSGSIPPELANLNNLRRLALLDNQLTGNIPSELGNLPNLSLINLRTNRLNGSIPSELGNIDSLQILDLSENQLSGSIPSELGNLNNLYRVSLENNNLSGCYPDNLLSFCTQFSSGDFNINSGNNFDTSWRDFCENGNGVCTNSNVDQSAVFNSYPWLSTYVNPNNCNGESITIYDEGSYNFVLIQNGNEGKLYFENGTFYCNETPTYSCVDAYGLTNVAQSWTCGNITSNSGCTDFNAINYNSEATVDDGSCQYENTNTQVFSTYPWLSTYVNQANCNGESITVYDAGSYNFVLIQNGNEGKLYFENGTFYCNETPTYSCVNAYGLTNVAQTWTCGDSTSTVSGCTDYNAINYNTNASEDDGSCQYNNINTPNCNLNDWAALKALYQNTAGDNWVNNEGWAEVKGSEPTANCNLSLLFGVILDGSGIVTELNLIQNLLIGTIPAELSNLSNLTSLNLTGNQLSGSISTELGNLNKLLILDLSFNQLSGNIPASLGNLSNLTSLALFGNQLTGNIPSELGNLTELNFLFLSLNKLNGDIPSELSNLVNLKELALISNQLSGSIPSELSNLGNLKVLGLSDNQLSGSIPAELGNLSNLESLGISNNQLSGSIPAELGNLSNLESLGISNNQLSGSIPAELGNLSNLVNLYLASNQLSGSIPAELGNLSKLTFLRIRDNNLNGCYPQNVRSFCTQLTDGFFDGNEDISEGNNFDTNWSNFCATNNGVCTENNSNNSAIFATYPWVSIFVNQSNCAGESITVYDAGSYNFILIKKGNESKLYFENGVFYCNETPSYSCVAAYGLTNIDEIWTCGNSTTEVNGCTNTNATNYNASATVDDGSCQYSTPDCSRYTGTFFYQDCGGINYYFIRLADGRVFDPYFAEGIGIIPIEGQQINFDFGIRTDITTPCAISESPITITCIETVESSVFEDYAWLSTKVNENNCSNESITVYDTGSYNFIFVQTPTSNSLYFQDGTFYCSDAPGYSCVAAYGLSNVVDSWSCGGFNNHKQAQSNTPISDKKISFNIYPNPTTSKVFINLPDEAVYQINLMDISGKIMKQVNTDVYESTVEIEVRDLTKGMYLVEIKNEIGSHIQKLVIE